MVYVSYTNIPSFQSFRLKLDLEKLKAEVDWRMTIRLANFYV
jgi:hypothetical protein